jgi:hypothetical protein
MIDFPDVREMWEALFPGVGPVGEWIAVIRDSYRLVDQHLDPGVGGRTLLCSALTFLISSALLLHRRSSISKSLMYSWVVYGLTHLFMATLVGLPWLLWPTMNWLMAARRMGTLVLLLILVTFVSGWGDHCLPEGSTAHDLVSSWLGFGRERSRKAFIALLTFGLAAASMVLMFM